MNDNELRKHVMGGKKSERVVFAVTPEMKSALELIAAENCTSVSALLTQLSLDEVLKNKNLLGKKDL